MSAFNQIPNQFASKGSPLSAPHYLIHVSPNFLLNACCTYILWDLILKILDEEKDF